MYSNPERCLGIIYYPFPMWECCMQQSGLTALGWTLCKHELETQSPFNIFFNLLPVIHQPDNCAEGVGRPGSFFRSGHSSLRSLEPPFSQT